MLAVNLLVPLSFSGFGSAVNKMYDTEHRKWWTFLFVLMAYLSFNESWTDPVETGWGL